MPSARSLAVAIVCFLGARTANAAPAPLPDTPEIKAAQALEKQAATDRSKAVPCGEAYVAIYNHDPEAAFNDQVLLAAAGCYELAGSTGAAILVLTLLQKYYPSSALTRQAGGKLGALYASVAMYDKAADRLEDFGRKFPSEPDAFAALRDAALYRRALGDDAKAIDDTKFLVATYGSKRKPDAAAAHFGLTGLYENRRDNDALIKHLREYLATFGAVGGTDRLVIANARLGMALWQASCPTAPIDGLCVKIVRERALPAIGSPRTRAAAMPTQCGPASRMRVTVIPRDARKVLDARRALHDAIVELERASGKTGGDEVGARYYYAQAKLAEADRELEEYLAIAAPTGLNFDPADPAVRKRSLVALDEWVARKTAGGRTASASYEAIFAIKDAASSIAAAARLGQVSETFADTLLTQEIPQAVRTGSSAQDKVDAYCDGMLAVAEPLERRATDAFGVCVTKATELGIATEWSALCERELEQMAPLKFPITRELRAEPHVTSPIFDVEPPVAGGPELDAASREFAAVEKAGWIDAGCKRVAGMFAAVAKANPTSAEARYMTGLSYHRCGMRTDAEKAYLEAVALGGTVAAMASSNLAALAYDAGKLAEARAGWEAALKQHGKLVAARIDLAWLGFVEMRKLAPTDAAWRRLDEDTRFHLANALGVGANVKAHTLLALVWMEGARVQRNRLELAKLSLAKAEALDGKYAPMRNAYGQYFMYVNAPGEALKRFTLAAAADADPQLVDGRMNLGLAAIVTRKFDVAKEQFAKALAIAPSYDALIGLGVALRGLKDFDGADAQYAKAQALDARRGEAYFDRALLHRDFLAPKRDVLASRADYVTARDLFTRLPATTASDADKAEAKANAIQCDTIIKQIDAFLAAQKKP